MDITQLPTIHSRANLKQALSSDFSNGNRGFICGNAPGFCVPCAPMNLKKLILWLAIGVVALFAIAVGLIKLLVSPAKIAAVITPRLERVLDRPVEVGETELTIFSGVGVRIHDIKIQNAPPFEAPAGKYCGSGHQAETHASTRRQLATEVAQHSRQPNLPGEGLHRRRQSDGPVTGTPANSGTGDDENELVCRQIGLQNGRLLYRNDSTGTRLVLGKIDANLNIGSGTQPHVESDLRVDSLFLWSGFGNFLISPSAGDLTWEGTYALASDSLIIDRCDWRLDKIAGRLDGAIAKPTSEPYFNVHIISEHTDLVDCYDSRIIAAIPVLRDMQLGGDLRIDIALRGGLRDNRTTTVRGKVTITGARAKFPTGDIERQNWWKAILTNNRSRFSPRKPPSARRRRCCEWLLMTSVRRRSPANCSFLRCRLTWSVAAV